MATDEQHLGAERLEPDVGNERPLKVAIFCTRFPPQNSTATRRPYMLARRLMERGHQVSVVTSRELYSTQWHPDLTGIDVVRLPLTRSRIGPLSPPLKLLSRLYWAADKPWSIRVMRYLADLFLPLNLDERLDIDEAELTARIGRQDVLVATGPGWSNMEYGHRFARHWNATYLIDYRDPWNVVLPGIGLHSLTWHGRSFFGMLRRARFRRLERRFTANAHALTATTELFTENSVRCTGITDAHTIYNCIPPEITPATPSRGETMLVLYAGGLHEEQEWWILIEALRIVAATAPEAADTLRVDLLGVSSVPGAKLESLREAAAANPMLRLHPRLDRERALGAIGEAHMLLNVTFEDISGPLPLKLVEYLGTGKPITNVGSKRDISAGVVTGTRTGQHFSDPQELAHHLLLAHSYWSRGETIPYHPDRKALERFTHAHQMGAWVDLIERVHAMRIGKHDEQGVGHGTLDHHTDAR